MNPSVIRAADQIVDLGPGQGERGGQSHFSRDDLGIIQMQRIAYRAILVARSKWRSAAQACFPCCATLRNTGIEGGSASKLILTHAKLYNLRDLNVRIPLQRLVCVTGVSGSGKTTLIRRCFCPRCNQNSRLKVHRPSTRTPVEASQADPLRHQAGIWQFATPCWLGKLGRVVLGSVGTGKEPMIQSRSLHRRFRRYSRAFCRNGRSASTRLKIERI